MADEAHHCISPSWQKVLTYFQGYTLGVTATPDRGDKKTLATFFQNIPYECTLIDLIKEGYLARIRVKTIPVRIDMAGVKVVAGDYSADDVGAAIAPHLGESPESWPVITSERKSLAFLPLIDISKAFVEAAAWARASSRACGRNEFDRSQARRFKRLASGETQLISNAMLFTEGIDCPPVDCILPLRPTKIRCSLPSRLDEGREFTPARRIASSWTSSG